ncbi:MAG TPA: hypothetical protein EYG74_03520 [Sulfurimonas autotrophica]|nr:hypothetical protein [Sulfurimonas autotrophica]
MLLSAVKMLPLTGKPSKYKVKVSSNDGYRTVLLGRGSVINKEIVKKINTAGKGDRLRIDYFILDYLEATKYFYNALKGAMRRGARVEIITEKFNTTPSLYIPEYTYRNSTEFIFGSNPSLYAGGGYEEDVNGLKYERKKNKNSFKIYRVDSGGDSLNRRALNHRKVALFDIKGKRTIIVSSANVTDYGERQWQIAVMLDGNHYDSHWWWWNDVLDADICFAKGNRNCKIGDGGYEVNYEGWITSYTIDKTKYHTMVGWLKGMKYSKGCALRMIMGEFDDSRVLDEMGRLAGDGCKVDLIYNNPGHYLDPLAYVKENFYSLYKKGTFEVERQTTRRNSNGKIIKNAPHQKMILWQGAWYRSNNIVSYAWVGTYNATRYATEIHDEAMIRIKDEKLFKAMWNYFQWIEYYD